MSVSATRAGRSSRTRFRRLGLRQRLAVAFVAVGVVATVATTVSVWAMSGSRMPATTWSTRSIRPGYKSNFCSTLI